MIKLFTFLALVASLYAHSQEAGAIKGTLTDLEMGGEPLILAEVSLKNTDWTTKTNLNGNFEIANVTTGTYTLEVRYLGYETLNLPIEVSENSLVKIEHGMYAKSISLEDMSFSDNSEKFENMAFNTTLKKMP